MYKLDILELDDNLEIIKKYEKIFFSSEFGKSPKKWYQDESGSVVDYPGCSSLFRIVTNHKATYRDNAIGYFYSDSNSVNKNIENCAIFTMGFSHGQGNCITKNNIYKVVSTFSARKIIIPNWENFSDIYFKPNETHGSFEQFKTDSIVYSLFESKSNQSSLRQVEYKDQLWDIKNEFFWMSVDKMKELSDQNGYDELYNDARTSPDRYVYKLLFGEERIYDKLSPDAKLVLDKATELVEMSMELRQVMANDENHLNSWDAGYAQLKLVWKEYFQEEFKEFRQLYKNLEDRMRPLVYELGFLKK